MAVDTLCTKLEDLAPKVDAQGLWPAESLALLGEGEVYRWFVPKSHGGLGWSDAQIVRGYARLAGACLTTAFVLTQRCAACRRLVTSPNGPLRDRFLPDLAAGKIFTTVGVSHLSTSRRHTGRPAVRATRKGSGYVLDGTSWWVTGAAHADHILVGAEMDGAQLLFWVPAASLRVDLPEQLVALTASWTAAVHLDGVEVSEAELVAGPMPQVFGASRVGGTGGIQTSALALGLAQAAATFMGKEAQKRPGIRREHQDLEARLDAFETDLVNFALGDEAFHKAELRLRANGLVLEATQAALQTAKGAGYLAGRAPGRWCREALFFLVWSVPPA